MAALRGPRRHDLRVARRPDDLYAVRPDDQGRYCLDGPRLGMPRAAARLPRGRIRRQFADWLQVSPRPRQMAAAAGLWASPAAGSLHARQNGLWRAARLLVPQ